MKFIPLFIILDAKPERSPKMPPPNDIIKSFLLKFLAKQVSASFKALCVDLNFSFTEYLKE